MIRLYNLVHTSTGACVVVVDDALFAAAPLCNGFLLPINGFALAGFGGGAGAGASSSYSYSSAGFAEHIAIKHTKPKNILQIYK